MLNFDPRTFGLYTPPEHSPLIHALEEIINITSEAMIDAADDMLNSSLLPLEDYDFVKSEKERWELELVTGSVLTDANKIDSAYRYLWGHFINRDCSAKAVDRRCDVYTIDRHFWTTEYATEALFSGEIKEIPPYRPHGRLIVENADFQKISDYHYRRGYRLILPSAPGRMSDIEALQDMYASSLIGETASLTGRGRGTSKKHDNEAFLIEVCALTHQYKAFKSKSELVRLSIDAYAAAHPGARRPSIRWADDVVGKVWDKLELKDTPVSELRRMRSDVSAAE